MRRLVFVHMLPGGNRRYVMTASGKQMLEEAMLRGECCSQLIVRISLKEMDITDENLIRAMHGLCAGTHYGGTCGLVGAAACVFALARPREEALSLTEDFRTWFEETYDSLECEILTDGNPARRVPFCREMTIASMDFLAELLDWENE